MVGGQQFKAVVEHSVCWECTKHTSHMATTKWESRGWKLLAGASQIVWRFQAGLHGAYNASNSLSTSYCSWDATGDRVRTLRAEHLSALVYQQCEMRSTACMGMKCLQIRLHFVASSSGRCANKGTVAVCFEMGWMHGVCIAFDVKCCH
jgi:hypothetical protein